MPFSVEQFFAVFAAYNEAVWPAQWLLTAAGVAALLSVLTRRPAGWRWSLLILGGLWLWMALAYHLVHFSRVNPAAPLFAALFAVGAALFLWRGARAPAPRLVPLRSWQGSIGLALAVFGLAVYALLNPLFGHHFPAAPGFGLPCPTTIFTLGILSFAEPRPDRSLLLVPVLWSAIGATAAFALGVPQDYVLAVAGVWGVALAFRHASVS